MSQATCTRCGRPLRDGLCPRGHPQRAARRRARKNPLRRLVLPVLILALLGAAGYAALWWYPARAAEELMTPASADFETTRAAYLDAADAYPKEPDADTLVPQASAQLAAAGRARPILSKAQKDLEARSTVDIPIVKGRPPLPLATHLRQRMMDFYIGGLELMTDLESVSRFLTELAPIIPRIEDLRGAVGNPRTPAQVDSALGAARPIAEQLVADVEALSPPAELGSAHESLKAIAARIRSDLDELDRVTGRGADAILSTLVDETGHQLDALRDAILSSPAEALKAGLRSRLNALDKQQVRIVRDLEELRDAFGLSVTVPQM